MNTDTQSPNSIPGLLHNLRADTTALLRQEVALAKAELSEKASEAASRSVKLAIGGFIAYAGLIVLLIALGNLAAIGLMRAGLDAGIAAWSGPAVVGLLVIIIGWAMLAKARKNLSADHLVPNQTLASLRENKQWAKHKFQPSHESAR